jgi:hypothetical protein
MTDTSVERPNPFLGVLPDDLRLGSLAAAMGALVKAVAWDVGERYDAVLSHRIGEDWLLQLARDRHGELPTLHDPSFVFAEAENHAESPVWLALPPRTPVLVDQLRRARVTRNRWEHDPARQSHETFLNGVDRFDELTKALGVPSRAHCHALRSRVLDLRRNGGVLPARDDLDNLQEMLDRAREDQAKAERAAAEQAAALGRAGGDADAARRDAESLREALALAQAERDRLEALVQAERQRQRLSAPEPVIDLTPGEDWNLPTIGSRVVTLKPRLVDLFDADLGLLLSEEMGPVAADAARRWLSLMPRGGPVHITEAGHAAARVDGRLIYLGRLDVVAADFTPGAVASGPWLPGVYAMAPGPDVVDLDTERSLRQERPDVAQELAVRLADVLQPDDAFRVTEAGVVAVTRNGQSVQVATIDPKAWFPLG